MNLFLRPALLLCACLITILGCSKSESTDAPLAPGSARRAPRRGKQQDSLGAGKGTTRRCCWTVTERSEETPSDRSALSVADFSGTGD